MSAGGVVLLDGPAAGRYSVRRAPHFLRAVVARSDGRIDLLDQLHDQPRPIEDVFVYEATGPTWDAESMQRQGTFVCPPPGASGEYRYRPDVAGETVRATAAWRAWARAQVVVDVVLIDPTAPAVPA